MFHYVKLKFGSETDRPYIASMLTSDQEPTVTSAILNPPPPPYGITVLGRL